MPEFSQSCCVVSMRYPIIPLLLHSSTVWRYRVVYEVPRVVGFAPPVPVVQPHIDRRPTTLEAPGCLLLCGSLEGHGARGSTSPTRSLLSSPQEPQRNLIMLSEFTTDLAPRASTEKACAREKNRPTGASSITLSEVNTEYISGALRWSISQRGTRQKTPTRAARRKACRAGWSHRARSCRARCRPSCCTKYTGPTMCWRRTHPPRIILGALMESELKLRLLQPR
jgi:hypothetical protein